MSPPPFLSLGAFKSLDKDGTGQIQVNIQEVRTPILECGFLARDPSPIALHWAPSLLFLQQPLGVRAEGSWYSQFPSSSLCALLSPVAAADNVFLNGNPRPLPHHLAVGVTLDFLVSPRANPVCSHVFVGRADPPAFPFSQSLASCFSDNS